MNENGIEKFEHNEIFIKQSSMVYVQGGRQTTLNRLVTMGHNNIVELMLFLKIRINVGHINCFPRKLMWKFILICAIFTP